MGFPKRPDPPHPNRTEAIQGKEPLEKNLLTERLSKRTENQKRKGKGLRTKSSERRIEENPYPQSLLLGEFPSRIVACVRGSLGESSRSGKGPGRRLSGKVALDWR